MIYFNSEPNSKDFALIKQPVEFFPLAVTPNTPNAPITTDADISAASSIRAATPQNLRTTSGQFFSSTSPKVTLNKKEEKQKSRSSLSLRLRNLQLRKEKAIWALESLIGKFENWSRKENLGENESEVERLLIELKTVKVKLETVKDTHAHSKKQLEKKATRPLI